MRYSHIHATLYRDRSRIRLTLRRLNVVYKRLILAIVILRNSPRDHFEKPVIETGLVLCAAALTLLSKYVIRSELTVR